jgi:hypothetical protein
MIIKINTNDPHRFDKHKRILELMDDGWVRVKTAANCAICPDCGEPYCLDCDKHYFECECPGPHQDDEYDYEYIGEGADQEIFAKKKP